MSEMHATDPTIRGVRVADLVALADGSLPLERRAAVVAQIHRSPALTGALSEQRRVVALIRSAQVRAPATLHRKVQLLLAERGLATESRHGRRAPLADIALDRRDRPAHRLVDVFVRVGGAGA